MQKQVFTVLVSSLLFVATASAAPLAAYSTKLASAMDSGAQLQQIIVADYSDSSAALDSTQLKIADALAGFTDGPDYAPAVISGSGGQFQTVLVTQSMSAPQPAVSGAQQPVMSPSLLSVTPLQPMSAGMTTPQAGSASPQPSVIEVSEPATGLLMLAGVIAMLRRRR